MIFLVCISEIVIDIIGICDDPVEKGKSNYVYQIHCFIRYWWKKRYSLWRLYKIDDDGWLLGAQRINRRKSTDKISYLSIVIIYGRKQQTLKKGEAMQRFIKMLN